MLEVKALEKSYGAKHAVRGVSFTVEKGTVLGFLGPNGAGKSTTMRMITGYYPPTTGSVTIGGVSILDNPIEAKKKFGYIMAKMPLTGTVTLPLVSLLLNRAYIPMT